MNVRSEPEAAVRNPVCETVMAFLIFDCTTSQVIVCVIVCVQRLNMSSLLVIVLSALRCNTGTPRQFTQ